MTKSQAQLLSDALSAPLRPGNSVTTLRNGEEIFSAMLEEIRSAQSHIELLTYVYWHSQVARDFANALCDRARAGVQVRLLIDAFGGAIMSTRMVGQLEQAGVRIAWFRPFNATHWRRFNHRNHRKILLVDGRVGFTGGVGIADQWDGDADGPKHWRETHWRIVGPACLDLAAGFGENWAEATGEHLTLPPVPAAAGSTAILTTASALGPRPTALENLFISSINLAAERLWITTAYFVPTPPIVEALLAAAARGVDVRILTNGSHSNHKLTLWAGRSTYDRLIAGGIKVYEYRRTVLHVKLMTIDRRLACIGSANIDNRSLVLNEELNMTLDDPALTTELDLQFLEDLKHARHIRVMYWLRRGWLQRFLEAGSRVFSKQL